MYARRAAEAALWSLVGLLVACGGGGGGAAGGSLVRDLGLVSGTEPTVRVVSFTNPLLEAATVTRVALAGPFSVDPASVPAEPVAAGASFDVRVVLEPGLPGPVTGSVRLSCQGAQEHEELVLALRATVEDVRVRAVEGVVDFGSVAFGDAVERTLELSNSSTLSVVTYTGLQTPSPDVEVLEPALPFALGPSQHKTVRLRAAPFGSLDTVNAESTLRAASVQGDVSFTVRLVPTSGRKVLDLGRLDLTDGVTEVVDVYVPPDVWSLHVAAWRPGLPVPDYTGDEPDAPPPGEEAIVFDLFESPLGHDHSGIWMKTNGTLATTLPSTPSPADQLDAGGGTYHIRLRVEDAPPPDAQLALVVVMKAAPGGQAPSTAILDLNVWLGSGTGVTPASAPQDAWLQAALQATQQMLQQIGVTLGDIEYRSYTELSGGGLNHDVWASIRAALPTTSGIVQNRLNLFCPSQEYGSGGRTPGPFIAYTNHSLCIAGYGSTTMAWLIVHEGLHHLGLNHVWEDGLSDTGTGFQPANVMDSTLGRTSTYISPQQGVVVRAHPFLR